MGVVSWMRRNTNLVGATHSWMQGTLKETVDCLEMTILKKKIPGKRRLPTTTWVCTLCCCIHFPDRKLAAEGKSENVAGFTSTGWHITVRGVGWWRGKG